MTKALALLISAAACAAAQSVEGAVIDSVTGAGIAGAKVMLRQGGELSYTVTTDAGGNFRFEDVADGTYRVFSGAEGYEMADLPPHPIQVKAGGLPVHVERRMTPFSRVTGRVVDGRGDPVPKANIELTEPNAVFVQETDGQGNFALNDIFPGGMAYTLSAAPPVDWKPPGPDPETGQPRRWAQTFYPGVALREQAASVVLRPGINLEAIELKLVAAPVHALRGVLLNPDGKPVPKAPIELGAGGLGHIPPDRAETKADGSFEFPAVVDGNWRLSAELPRSGADTLRATEWIDMAGRDLGGLKLRLAPPFAVHGTVIVEVPQGAMAPRLPGVGMNLMHGGRTMGTFLPVFPNQDDGRFRINNVYSGSYTIDPAPAPRPYYLDSIRLGDTPVVDEVELSGAAPEITVVYKTNGGTVRGAVEKCASGRVWLVSRDRPRWGSFSTLCDAGNRFQIASLRPGAYYALALEDNIWSPGVDPVYLQNATAVNVRPGETTEIELKLSTVR